MAISVVRDTNVILYELADKLTQPLPPGPYAISVISEMELLSYPSIDADEHRAIMAFLAGVEVIELTRDVREMAIRFRRLQRLKLADAIIAGTASVLGIYLKSANRQ